MKSKMGWISLPPFFVVFILLQTVDVHAYNGAAWANAETAETVLNFFSDFLQYTELFNSEQMEEIKDIGDTITMLMDQMVLFKKTSSAIFQALDTAFASSIAKLIAQEDQGESLSRKKSAIFDGFKAALKYVTGTEDEVYLNEIRSLVSTFTDGLPINSITSLSQTVSSDSSTPERNVSTAQVNVQGYLSPREDLKVPNSLVLSSVTQNSAQQFPNQPESSASAASSSGGQTLDLINMQKSTTSEKVASSIVVSDSFNQFGVGKFKAGHPEIFSSLTSGELVKTPNLPQPTTDLRGSMGAIAENAFHEQNAEPKSVNTPVANSGQPYLSSSVLSSSSVVINDARLLGNVDEDSDDDLSLRKMTDGSELFTEKDLKNSNSSYVYQSLVPKTIIYPDVTNEEKTYSLSFGEIPSFHVLDSAAQLSSEEEDLNYDSQKTKNEAAGLLTGSDNEKSNPSYDYKISVPETVISVDLTNGEHNYPLTFHESSSSELLGDTVLLSSGVEDLDDKTLRMESDAGQTTGSELQNREHDPQSSAYAVFVNSLSDELYYSDTFYEMFESDISTEEAVGTLISLTDSVSENLGLNSLIDDLEDAVYGHISALGPSSDALEYAVEFASAIAEILANNGIIMAETAEDMAYTFADVIESLFGTATKSKSGAVFSSTDVNIENQEGANVQEFGDYANEGAAENSSPISTDRSTSTGSNQAPSVLSTPYRLYSENAIDRISSVISQISSMQQVNSYNLGTTASQLRSMISANYPNLSDCETLHQVYSEILSAFIHILNTGGDYPVNDSDIEESAAIMSETLKYLA